VIIKRLEFSLSMMIPILLTFTKALEAYSQFVADTFNDPIEALSRFKVKTYDLLIIDIRLPQMDGFELYDKK
jgi:DNA-binding response OmpR family regulator